MPLRGEQQAQTKNEPPTALHGRRAPNVHHHCPCARRRLMRPRGLRQSPAGPRRLGPRRPTRSRSRSRGPPVGAPRAAARAAPRGAASCCPRRPSARRPPRARRRRPCPRGPALRRHARLQNNDPIASSTVPPATTTPSSCPVRHWTADSARCRSGDPQGRLEPTRYHLARRQCRTLTSPARASAGKLKPTPTAPPLFVHPPASIRWWLTVESLACPLCLRVAPAKV
mmetsp:Transcript_68536/g.174014  ORF Transcript_68536/g.174014 Transcript_68536/m.174014 type:complete len:227 (-) Transcript_68536:49-729(-)